MPGARSALVLLLLINLFNYIDRQVLAAVVPNIREFFFGPSAAPGAVGSSVQAVMNGFEHAFGFKPENALIGTLSMAFMLVYIVAAPIFGHLSERISRWFLVGVGVVLWSFASGASGLATSFGVLLLTRCFVGIGEAAYGPVAPTVLSDYYPVKVRGRVLSLLYVAVPVGSALGFVLGEQMAQSRLGWPWAFYAVVPPGIALGVWAFLMREPGRGAADRAVVSQTRRIRVQDYVVLTRIPTYLLNTVAMTAMTFSIGGIGFWMPDYLKTYRGVTGPVSTVFGIILVVAGLSGTMLGGMAGDRLRGRFPGSYLLVSGSAMIIGFPFFLGILYAPFPFAWLFVFLACFCLFFNTGPSNAALANITPPAIRATAFALNILIIHAFGDVASPLLIGIISDRYQMNAAFLLVSMMFLVSGAFWLWGARYLQRDTERAPQLCSPKSV
jgi:MFS family permease